MTSSLRIVTPNWSAPENIVAYTTTRAGGVSEGVYDGLNVGMHVGDMPIHVQQNRAKLPGSQNIRWLNQVHGNNVVELTNSEDTNTVPQADAAISTSPLCYCAVMTADCVPILLCDIHGTQVAAVHAGWQGLYKDIIAATVAFFDTAPSNIMAWVGPSISGECYEVDEALAQRFHTYPNAVTTGKRHNKFQLNLPLVAQTQLSSIGVGHIFSSDLCTYSHPETFYSHRFATHQGHSATGRMVSVIGLR